MWKYRNESIQQLHLLLLLLLMLLLFEDLGELESFWPVSNRSALPN